MRRQKITYYRIAQFLSGVVLISFCGNAKGDSVDSKIFQCVDANFPITRPGQPEHTPLDGFELKTCIVDSLKSEPHTGSLTLDELTSAGFNCKFNVNTDKCVKVSIRHSYGGFGFKDVMQFYDISVSIRAKHIVEMKVRCDRVEESKKKETEFATTDLWPVKRK